MDKDESNFNIAIRLLSRRMTDMFDGYASIDHDKVNKTVPRTIVCSLNHMLIQFGNDTPILQTTIRDFFPLFVQALLQACGNILESDPMQTGTINPVLTSFINLVRTSPFQGELTIIFSPANSIRSCVIKYTYTQSVERSSDIQTSAEISCTAQDFAATFIEACKSK